MPGDRKQQKAPRRRSQAERRAATRARILDAATHVFADIGYEVATMDQVAAAAEVSKGGLYWAFPSKEELLFALLDERLDQPLRALFDAIKEAPTTADTAPWTSQALAALITEHPGLVLVLHDIRALAARHPRLRERFAAQQQRLRREMGDAFETRYARTGVPLPFSGERLATAVIALAEGLALTRLADPSAPTDDLLGDILTRIYNGIAADHTLSQ